VLYTDLLIFVFKEKEAFIKQFNLRNFCSKYLPNVTNFLTFGISTVSCECSFL